MIDRIEDVQLMTGSVLSVQVPASIEKANSTLYTNEIMYTMGNTHKYSELTGKIIGAAMEVHTTLGCGFQEVIYQRALSYEMKLRNIEHQREVPMDVVYKDFSVGQRRVDFLVDGVVSVEIKAISRLEDVHLAQAINYLEAYHLEVGLLINFGERSLKFKRVVNS